MWSFIGTYVRCYYFYFGVIFICMSAESYSSLLPMNMLLVEANECKIKQTKRFVEFNETHNAVISFRAVSLVLSIIHTNCCSRSGRFISA
jgi:hypothetical protein